LDTKILEKNDEILKTDYPNLNLCFKEIYHVLKPGGVFLLNYSQPE